MNLGIVLREGRLHEFCTLYYVLKIGSQIMYEL